MRMLEPSRCAQPSSARNRESCTSAVQGRAFPHRTNPQGSPKQLHRAARAGASGRGFTHLEQHLLQRGPPGWEWLLRPPLQLLPGQRKKGKNTIKIRVKFGPGEWMYLPAEAAQQRGRISAVPHRKSPAATMALGRSVQPVLHRPEQCFTNFHILYGRLVQALPGRNQAVREQGTLWIYIPLLPPRGLYLASSTP